MLDKLKYRSDLDVPSNSAEVAGVSGAAEVEVSTVLRGVAKVAEVEALAVPRGVDVSDSDTLFNLVLKSCSSLCLCKCCWGG